MIKRIVLCADDYGQTYAISQGIIKLIQMGRVTAVSCMVNAGLWQDHAKWLFPFYKQIDIGLHLNLTKGKPLSNEFGSRYEDGLSLSKLLRHAFLRKLDKDVLEAECNAQIDCFMDNLGFLPHFIDGHHHVHQFPIVRQALIRVYEKRLRREQAYISLINGRVSLSTLKEFKLKEFKKAFIQATGTRALKRLLHAHHIPHNSSFSGMYPMGESLTYEALFPRFLQEISNKGLIICHPSLLAADENADKIAKARFAEYQYLVGGRFLRDCYEKGVMIGKFR